MCSSFLKTLSFFKSFTVPETPAVSKILVVPISDETLTILNTGSVSKPLFRPKPEDVLKFLAAIKYLAKTVVVSNALAPLKTITTLAITGNSSTYQTHLDFLRANHIEPDDCS